MSRLSQKQRIRRFSMLLLAVTVTAGLPGCKKAVNNAKVGSVCTTETECGPGMVCDCPSGTCQPADQGNPYCSELDAKVPEAGPVDAGRDAAPLQDASPSDAVPEDADMKDGGKWDASMDDGGTTDASIQETDAGRNAP